MSPSTLPRWRRGAVARRAIPVCALAGASGRRAFWGFIDQGVSSLTNFEVTLFTARTDGPHEFGTFSLAMIFYVFVLWVSRSLSTEPLVVRWTDASPESLRSAARGATGAALVTGLAAGGVLLGLGLVTRLSPPAVPAVIAVSMPVLLTQDAYRYVLMAAGRTRPAALNDVVWLLAQSALVVAFAATGHAGATTAAIAFGCGALVSTLLAVRQSGAVPSLPSARQWLSCHRDLSLPFVLELVTVAGTLQVALLGIAATIGVVALGQLRAGMLLLAPLTVLFSGVFVVSVLEGVRLRDRPTSTLVQLVVLLGAAMTLATALWTVAVLLLPESIGIHVLGSNWSPAREVLIPVAVLIAGSGCALAGVAGLRSLGAARQSLAARLWGAPVILLGGLLGALVGGAYGAALGLAAASWLDTVIVWRAFRRAVRAGPSDRGHEPTTQPLA